MIVMYIEQEPSWDVGSQSLTSSTNTPEKVTTQMYDIHIYNHKPS